MTLADPEPEGRNPAQEAELARLISEQESDDTDRIWSRELSFDAPLGSDTAFSLLDTMGEQDDRLLDLVGDNETFMRLVTTRGVTREDVKLWRYLRTRQGWTYQQIADHAGVHHHTVRNHIATRKSGRTTPQGHALKGAEKRAGAAYEAGAKLIEVAQVLYQEAGYKTPESCYQALRRLFFARGHAIRPKSWKHGRTSRAASHDVRMAYWREHNRRVRDRRRDLLGYCQATTRESKRCSRWAREGTTLCNVHAGLSGEPTVWTPDAILAALNAW